MKELRESVRFVVENAVHVEINHKALSSLASDLAKGDLKIPAWDYTHHYFDGTEKTLFYLFVLDTLNFCFWPQPGHPRWAIKYEGETLSGYNGLAAALTQAFKKGIPLDDPTYLASMKMPDLQEILCGEGQLQLMGQRLKALKELGRFFLERWEGSPARFVEAARGSAIWLALKVGREIGSFRDIAQYRGRRVLFYKRAQILAADIHGAFQGRGWGEFHDMHELTAFADYKLPQVLRQLRILVYYPLLAAKVDAKKLIPPGSPEEVEIRAHTIYAVDQLCAELKERGINIRAFEMDWLLWNMGQEAKYRRKPYHRTVTIFY